MSNPTALDEGRQIFVEESRDLLRSMEEALLALESRPDDVEALNALFRAAHTIKGSAGLFAFDQIVAFTHVLENVLDRVRGGQQTLETSLMELALRCRDHVGSLLDVVTATGADADLDPEVSALGDALVASLNEYLGHGDIGSAAAAATAPISIKRAAWHISVRFGVNVLRNGMDPLSILRYLGTLGALERVITVRDHLPARDSFDPESCYLGFELLLQTTASEAEVRGAFDFVLDDCALHIIPPGAPLGAYSDLLAQLPEPSDRAGELLVACGALTPHELDALRMSRGGVHLFASTETTTDSVAPAVIEPPPAEAPGLAAAPQNSLAEASPPPASRAQSRASESGRSIRVPADKLDRLITLVGELVIAGSASSTLARSYADPSLQEATATVDGLVQEIRDSALRLRMVQVGETFHRFDRVVRDVSRELGKDIALVVSGGETELDKSMVEQINDPLTHIVRNAMDHGIEDPETRLRVGKSARGQLRLHAHHDSGQVVIEISDDGRGLDRDKLLAKGRERGLVGPNEVPSDEEILGLIFEPGFSTAAKITNLSGRGVGMDVVRRNINELRGSVTLASEVGAGTTVIIRLPLTLAIIDGFLVKVGRGSYVAPLDTVFECIELPPEYRERPVGGDYLNLRGQVLPLLRLREVFQVSGQATGRQSVVVLQNGPQRAGLVVDQLLGEHQTVIKPLGKLFASVPGVGGSTVLGTGEVALILDVPGLLRRALARQGGSRKFSRTSGAVLASATSDSKAKGSKDERVS